MPSLRSLILADLQCFDLNLIDEENHIEDGPVSFDVTTSDFQVNESDSFYSLIEDRKETLNDRIAREIQAEPLIEDQVLLVQAEPLIEDREPLIEDREPLIEDGGSQAEPASEDFVDTPKKPYAKKTKAINLTEQWIFHPAYNRFEKIEKELCRNLKTASYFKIPADDQIDRVHDFMVWLIEVDHLRTQLEKDKDIVIGAIWHHFTQWLVRLGHKMGKDILSREKEGARTQAQLIKRSEGVEQVFEAPTVARQVRNEGGEVIDMFDENQVDDFDFTIREKALNQKVFECLKLKFPNQYEFYNQLFLDKLYQKYPSVVEWSQAIDIPERVLRHHLDRMTKKLQSFGRELFLS